LGFKKGDIIKYGISHEMKAKIFSKESKEAIPALQINYDGNLIIKIYEAEGEGWISGFEVQNLKYFITTGEKNQKVSHDELARMMSEEVLVYIRKDGMVGRIAFPNGLGVEAMNNWKIIISEWQVLLPTNEKGQNKWTRSESDTMGTYFAEYSILNSEMPLRIEKIKSHYAEPDSTGDKLNLTPKPPRITSSTIKITLNPFQIDISGKEVLNLNTELGDIDSMLAFSFKLLEKRNDPLLPEISSERKTALHSSNSFPNWVLKYNAEQAKANNRISYRDAGDIVSDLKKTISEKSIKSQEALEIMIEMIDAIANDKNGIPIILDFLSKNKDNLDLASAITGVIGAAGTKEAQQGLIDISTNKALPDSSREMALQSLVQVTSPATELDKALLDIYGSEAAFNNTALLLLGAMGNKIKDFDPVRYENIKKTIYELGANSSDWNSNDQLNLLSAIGNLGDEEIPGFVKQYLKNDNESLRRGVLLGIERNYSSEAYDIICQLLTNDPSAGVRGAAANLLGDKARAGAGEFLVKQYGNEKNEDVRMEILKNVYNWGDADAQVKGFIKKTADSDSSEKVRTLAKELLGQTSR
jgi:HEAT repeat protein